MGNDNNNSVGRPTKYTKEYLDELAEKLKSWTKERFDKMMLPAAPLQMIDGEMRVNRTSLFLKEFEFEHRIPRGMLAHLVDRKGDYAEINESLAEEYGFAMIAQEIWLARDPDIPNSSRKLMLMHNHGLVERKSIDFNGNMENTNKNTNVNLNLNDIVDMDLLREVFNEGAVPGST